MMQAIRRLESYWALLSPDVSRSMDLDGSSSLACATSLQDPSQVLQISKLKRDSSTAYANYT